MFTSIANYLTRSKIHRQNSARKKQFSDWHKIEKIALVIDEIKNLNKSEADKFIEGLKKYTGVFYVEPSSKLPSFSDWTCFSKKDKTILNLPKSIVLNNLNSKKFDLVISVSGQNPLFTANITSQINAAFKCGNNNLFGELDLIIERKDKDLVSYLKEVVKYLQMIRTE